MVRFSARIPLAVGTAALLLTACNVEINVHVDSDPRADEADASSPEAVEAMGEEPGAPDALLVPERFELPDLPMELLQVRPNTAIRDALWRPEASEYPRPMTEGRDIRSKPSFTPFTMAPEITNRRDVARATRRAYTARMERAGLAGTARLYFFVEADGKVTDVRLDRSSGHEALDDAAVDVGRAFRFRPAENRGTPVPVWVSFPITFPPRG